VAQPFLQPDFSKYPAAAASVGLLFMAAAFTTPGRAILEIPVPYWAIGAFGAAFFLHGIWGLYSDWQRRIERERRMIESMQDYTQSTVENPDLAGISTEEGELPEGEFDDSVLTNER
jgi:hypothetical protein